MIHRKVHSVNKEARELKFRSFLPLLLGLYLLYVVVKGAFEISRSYSRLDTAKFELEAEKQKNAKLTEKLTYVKSGDYVEKVIRNDLNMVKEGEYLFVDEGGDQGKAEANNVDTEVRIKKNWEKWLDLIIEP